MRSGVLFPRWADVGAGERRAQEGRGRRRVEGAGGRRAQEGGGRRRAEG